MRSLCRVVIAFAVGVVLYALPAVARADTNCVVDPGLYSVTWQRAVVNLINVGKTKNGGFTQQTVSHSDVYGDVTLVVDCDGTVTIKTPASTAHYSFGTYTRVDGPGVIDHRAAETDVPFSYVAAGKAHAGLNRFPDFNLTVTNSSACPEGADHLTFCLNAGTETWSFVGVRDDSDDAFKKTSGNKPFNGKSHANFSSLPYYNIFSIVVNAGKNPFPLTAFIPGNHTGAFDGYTMSRAASPPTVSVTQDLETVFLDNVPSVTLEIRAYVESWGAKGAKGKSVSFEFEGGKPQEVPAAQMKSDTAVVNIEVGNLKAGDHLVTVKATNLAGLTVTAKPFAIHVIPTPPWLRTFDHLKADGIAGICAHYTECEEYSASRTFPAKPVSAGVNIPDTVPVVGGTWGLTPTSFTIKPLPLSRLNGHDPGAPIVGTGSFGLGSHLFTIAPRSDSRLFTKTTNEHLELTDADVRFDAAELPFTKHIGLTSVVAGLADLAGSKGIGDWLRSADIAGVDASIITGMEGARLELAAAPTDANVKITKFVTQLDLSVNVNAAINIGLIRGGAQAQVSGALNLSMSPSPKVENCKISFIGFVYYTSPLFTGGTYPASPTWTDLTTCKPATVAADRTPLEQLTDAFAAVAKTNARPLFAQAEAATGTAAWTMPARDASIRDALVARTATHQQPHGRMESTLVDGAPAIAAAPALAAGPHGRLALVWIGENLHAPRPQAFQSRLRLFDGRHWAASAPFIGSGDRPDALPAVTFDGNENIVAAWSVNTTPGLNASTPEMTQQKNLQLEVVVCDGRNGAVLSRRLVSAGTGPHVYPRARASADGGVWLAWERFANADEKAASASASIIATHWDRRAWSAPETIASDVRGLADWQLAGRDGANAVLAIDATDGGKRTIRVSERRNGTWTPRFSTHAAAFADPRVAVGYDRSGVANALWEDGGAVMRERAGTTTTLAKDGGVPIAFANDGDAVVTLVRTPAGYVSLRTDSHGTAAPVSIAPLVPTFALPDVARNGDEWLIAQAPLMVIPGRAPSFGGTPVVIDGLKR